MKTRHTATIAVLAVVGGLAVAGLPALAQGTLGGGYGGMMGGGYGAGPGAGYHMGYGMGYGMGRGMMGAGFGPGADTDAAAHPCLQNATATDLNLDVDGARARLEAWLAMRGNARLTLGNIEIVDDDTIAAEIVTVDNSLVETLAIDRHTGLFRPVR